MKNYGKYEKKPEGVPAKQPKVKNLLLQTYFTSLLCLVLCVTMFFGTSYAWFTSEAVNPVNEIYVGTLAVGLYKGDTDLNQSDEKLFDGSIRWEPGYTALETIRVVNKGELAFDYVLSFTDGSLVDKNDGVELANVAGFFDVWVYDPYQGKEYVKPDSYAAITANDSGWRKAGTLKELLAGKPVLSGEMYTVLDNGKSKPTTDTFTIALHMSEDADADVMGQKIILSVKLIAYQKSSEDDVFDNQYDSGVKAAADAASLQVALNESGSIQLISDVKIGNVEECLTMNGGTLYGNGKTITYSGGRDSKGSSVGVLTTSGGTIKNLTIEGSEDGRGLYITNLTSDLSVSNCVLSGAYSFNLNSSQTTDYTLSFENTTFKGWTSYANVAKSVEFTGCTFEGTLRPYGDTILENCNFSTEGLDVAELKDNETITLINCTYKGVLIEKAVLTAENGTVKIVDSNLIKINDDSQVVLANG